MCVFSPILMQPLYAFLCLCFLCNLKNILSGRIHNSNPDRYCNSSYIHTSMQLFVTQQLEQANILILKSSNEQNKKTVKLYLFIFTLPLSMRAASYWSEVLKTTQFLTVAFLLLPLLPFDLLSRKRSLYFDFYIRYLTQLFLLELFFYSLSAIWPKLLAVFLHFPFHTLLSVQLHFVLTRVSGLL